MRPGHRRGDGAFPASRAITRLPRLLGRDEALAMALLPLWQAHLPGPPADLVERLVQSLARRAPTGSSWISGTLVAAAGMVLVVLATTWILAWHHPSQGSARRLAIPAVIAAPPVMRPPAALIASLVHDPSARVRRAVAARLAQDCLGLERASAPPSELARRLRAALIAAEQSDADSWVRAMVARALERERDEWLLPPSWQQGGAGDLKGPWGTG